MTSRGELRRAFKDRQLEAGVFLITNTAKGKVYLGSSTNLHGPLNKHRFMLSIGAHPNRGLQEDWATHGAEAFTFEILERVRPSQEAELRVEAALELLEQRWLARVPALAPVGYNTSGRIRE